MGAKQVSINLIEVLKEREELRLEAYKDQAGVWTIGWGATRYESGNRVQPGDKITEARAVQLLNYHVGNAASGVITNVKSELTQGQFDALTSFVYNAGRDAFAKSNLRVLVNTNPNDFDLISKEFMRWKYVTVNGVKVVSNGLINRRKEEIAMYTSGNYKKNSGAIWIAAVIVILILRKYAQR